MLFSVQVEVPNDKESVKDFLSWVSIEKSHPTTINGTVIKITGVVNHETPASPTPCSTCQCDKCISLDCEREHCQFCSEVAECYHTTDCTQWKER